MISPDVQRTAIRTLAEAANPRRIVLFGSYARGDMREDSDLDLLVVEDNVGNRANEMVRLRRLLRPLRIPVDVLVCSTEEADRWQDATGTVVYWAMREGKIVHG